MKTTKTNENVVLNTTNENEKTNTESIKRQITVSELSEITKTVPQYLYKILQKPEDGKVYTKDSINYTELQKFLIRKFETLDKVLEVFEVANIEDIEIVKSNKITNSNTHKVSLDSLELNSKYILRSYHHEITVILKSISEIDEDIVYIFEVQNTSKNSQDKYRILTETELKQERFTIKLV